MPLLRYILFTSATLLGLLFLADWYFPATPVAAARDDIDHTTIRIHSRHKWPEAVRMDTSMPLVTASPTPSAPVTAEAPAQQPAAVAQAEAPRPFSSKTAEQASRHAKPTRRAQRERSRRFAERRQRFASYRDPEWQSWSFPSW
ncbi:hypothetical protein [Bradyrhizobium sp. UFLA03-84]|uniref:hypothetical protein n=1 Tax=Bradyrhizobium sp. UFLA03-84 TaxID=418599 RepID=UPI001178B7AC|nr:hypothetical protein [Bradyrhizobium sp. UFLA03-84]